MFLGPVTADHSGLCNYCWLLIHQQTCKLDFEQEQQNGSAIYEEIWRQWFVIITAIPSPDGSPDEMNKNGILFVAGDRCRLGRSSGISSDTQHTASSGASHRHVCVVAIPKTVKWIIGLLSGVFKDSLPRSLWKAYQSGSLFASNRNRLWQLEQEGYFLDEHGGPSTTDERLEKQALYTREPGERWKCR